VVGVRVSINQLGNTANEPDDALGIEVSGGSFSREKYGFSHELRALFWGRSLQITVTLDDGQGIQQLPLVPVGDF
jgi:hypothetical protein